MAGELGKLTRSLQAFSSQVESAPLDFIRWLPAQHRFLSSPARRKLFRAGNQSQGKTLAALSDVLFRCLGEHPFLDVPPPPIDAMVITASWAQGLAVQKKLFEILPKGVLHPDCEYDPVRGFRGRNPATRFRNGSLIRWKTTQQGALQLASATLQVCLFDEPPTSPRIYSEVSKRLQRAGADGVLLLAMTPVNAPVGWIKELCEQGQIEDIHSPLTPAAMIPIGSAEPLRLDDGTPCDEDWIEQIRMESLPYEVPVVVDGEWEFRTIDRVFEAFDLDLHVSPMGPVGPATLCLGFDHGSKIGKQIALLVAVQGRRGQERIWVLDESVGGARTSVRDDARDVLRMLERNEVKWRSIDHAWGDRLYIRGKADRKSNADLMREVSRELGLRRDSLRPEIRTVKRGKGRQKGSVDLGCRFLHQAMLREASFTVHPKCEHLIESLSNWCYTQKYSDCVDALRYSLTSYIFSGAHKAPKPTVRLG